MSNEPVIKNEQDRFTITQVLQARWTRAMDRYEGGHLPSLVAVKELEGIADTLNIRIGVALCIINEVP